MKIAAAQIASKEGPEASNLEEHYRLIRLAAEQGVQLLIFPELSITGYTREHAAKQSFSPEDKRLQTLKALSVQSKMTLVVGAPIQVKDQLHIGSFILFPDGKQDIYTKQFLHPGEEISYSPSFAYNPHWSFESEKVALAICADIDHPVHAEQAKANGASLYLASIFFSKNGIAKGHSALGTYAKEYGLHVLMSNFTGPHWNTESAGQSAFWNRDGVMLGALDCDSVGLLIAEGEKGNWVVSAEESTLKYGK